MKTLRLSLVVLTSVVILGIVGCTNRDSIISDDTEFTDQSIEATTETTEAASETDAVATPTATSAPRATATPTLTTVPTATSTQTPEVVESSVTTDVQATEATQAQTPNENVAPNATQESAATATQAPVATSTPTSTPIPTATPEPTSTPTPSPEPVVIDIDASAQANGYVAIDVDMGNGTTQRVYGYFVDMSGLDARVNDYRESIGLSRLPTDTAHIEEMKIRAVEASIPGYLSHQRPNGSWGTEANIVSGTDVDDCYQRLYESDGHRASWEDEYATTIYSVGFRRMVFDESTGTWSGGGGATVQYTDYSF